MSRGRNSRKKRAPPSPSRNVDDTAAELRGPPASVSTARRRAALLLASACVSCLAAWSARHFWKPAVRKPAERGAPLEDASASDDRSCLADNRTGDDDVGGTDGGDDVRVHPECRLVMAPSGYPDGGWGRFTLAPLGKGRRVGDQGDNIIHIPDPNPETFHLGMSQLWYQYAWQGQDMGGHYEGVQVYSLSVGVGTLANGLSAGDPNVNVERSSFAVDDAGLRRGVYPGAGAVSHHHNHTYVTTKDIAAGDELVVSFGGDWLERRGLSGGVPHKKFDLKHLREVGYCLDNIVTSPSRIDGAGRGAFASRDLAEGSVVAPLPLIPLLRKSLEMVRPQPDGTVDKSRKRRDGNSQLLQNYCLGHKDSSLLLYPYSLGVNHINHNKSSNVLLRWQDESVLEDPWNSRLTLELVATRRIFEGEELYLDYGGDWVEAWEDHVKAWKPREEDARHVSAETMNANFHMKRYLENNDVDGIYRIRTQREQMAKPYPKGMFQSCYYRYSDHAQAAKSSRSEPCVDDHDQCEVWAKRGECDVNPKYMLESCRRSCRACSDQSNLASPVRSLATWIPSFAEASLRPCMVIKREETSNNYDPFLYTVQIMHRPKLSREEIIPKGHMHYVTKVPRRAIKFSDALFRSDQHLPGFRQEIGLGDVFPEKWKDLLN